MHGKTVEKWLKGSMVGNQKPAICNPRKGISFCSISLSMAAPDSHFTGHHNPQFRAASHRPWLLGLSSVQIDIVVAWQSLWTHGSHCFFRTHKLQLMAALLDKIFCKCVIFYFRNYNQGLPSDNQNVAMEFCNQL